MERVHCFCRRFGTKVNKYSEVVEHKTFFALEPFDLKPEPLTFDSFKLLGMFR